MKWSMTNFVSMLSLLSSTRLSDVLIEFCIIYLRFKSLFLLGLFGWLYYFFLMILLMNFPREASSRSFLVLFSFFCLAKDSIQLTSSSWTTSGGKLLIRSLLSMFLYERLIPESLTREFLWASSKFWFVKLGEVMPVIEPLSGF
jgi:hypothetical protein